MALQLQDTPDRLVAYFTDTKILDESSIHKAGDELLEYCRRAAGEKKKLVVDFRDVEFMSSAMIGKLVVLNKLATQQSVDLRLANVCQPVFEVFEITRLHKVFRFDDGEDDRASSD